MRCYLLKYTTLSHINLETMFTPYWKLSAKSTITHRAQESIKKHISAFSMWKSCIYSEKSLQTPRT